MPSTLLSCILAATAAAGTALPNSRRDASPPTVELASGAYYGLHKPSYNQDEFLGIPYAQPPLGALRLSPPQPLNETWDSPRNATEYSPQCIGYGSDTWVLGNYISEDCLTLNVVRPHGVAADAQLPVAVWIHGGGLTTGGSSDPRYNLTFIVEQSVAMGTPIVAASINYRLSGWGFLWGSEVEAAGAGNLGYRDQRLALEWVQENIGAFGGDPEEVTIWGESAGARSVAAQLLAYGGRDDGLFRAAIMQSGTGLYAEFDDVEPAGVSAQEHYDAVAEAAGCTDLEDSLTCLKELDTQSLSDIFNATANSGFGSIVDGDFITGPRADLLKAGKFVPVPLLIGANADEGAQFGTKGIYTDAEWVDLLASDGAGNTTIEDLSALYPDDPAVGLPSTLEGRPSGDYGDQWKRVVAYAGDKDQHAPRRWWAREWARQNQTAYSYQFNVLTNGMPAEEGSSHFQEVAFVFNNVDGLGYDNAVAENPFEGMPATFGKLADTMSRMWVSFITTSDPNYNGGMYSPVSHAESSSSDCVVATCKRWPVYSVDEPKNMAFNVNTSSVAYAERDTYRTEQIEYLISKLWDEEADE